MPSPQDYPSRVPLALLLPPPGRRPTLVLLGSLLAGVVGLLVGGPWAVAGAVVAVGGCLTAYVLQFRALWYADPPAHDHDRRFSGHSNPF